MQLYYDVTLQNESTNCSISYLADSFSVDEHRILRIKSKEWGNVTVKIEDDERLIVNEIELKDEFDDFE